MMIDLNRKKSSSSVDRADEILIDKTKGGSFGSCSCWWKYSCLCWCWNQWLPSVIKGSLILRYFESSLFIIFISILFLFSFGVTLIAPKICYDVTPVILSSNFPFLFPSFITGYACIYWLFYLFSSTVTNKSSTGNFLFGDVSIRIRRLNKCKYFQPMKVDKVVHKDLEGKDNEEEIAIARNNDELNSNATTSRLTAQFQAMVGEGQTIINLENLKEQISLPQDRTVIDLIFSLLTVTSYNPEQQRDSFLNTAFQYTFTAAVIVTSYNFFFPLATSGYCIALVYLPWNFMQFFLLACTSAAFLAINWNLRHMIRHATIGRDECSLLFDYTEIVSCLLRFVIPLFLLFLFILLAIDLIRSIIYPEVVSFFLNLLRIFNEFGLLLSVMISILEVNKCGDDYLAYLEKYRQIRMNYGHKQFAIAYRFPREVALRYNDVIGPVFGIVIGFVIAFIRATLGV